jgi:hypothetical protein
MYRPNLESEFRNIASGSVSRARSGLLQNKTLRNTILYMLVVLAGFALTGYLGHLLIVHVLKDMPDAGFWGYAIILSIVLLLGMLHVSSLRAFMKWIRPDDYLQGTLITLLMGIIGGLAIFFLSFMPRIFGFTDTQELKANVRPLVTTVLAFPLAYFVQWAFETFEKIPPKVYKLWKYNALLQMPQLTEREFSQTIMVIFMLDIRSGEKNPWSMRSKIPNRMMIGDGFQFSIDEHNEKEPGREIEYRTVIGDYHRWYFYVKRPWWKGDLFIDPDKTCLENQISDGARIQARRLPVAE